MVRNFSFVWCVALLALAGCGDDGGDATADAGADAGSGGDAVSDAGDGSADVGPPPLLEEVCDATRRPIVMAHGFLASGDTWGLHFQRFSANGYCRDRLFAYDWNTLDRSLDSAALLDAFIVDVLAKTGATQVDLAGHSAGGGLGYTYLEDAERAARVANYAHIGSFSNEAPAGPEGGTPVPTLHLYSEGDLIVDEGADIPGATNVRLIEEDHYGVATSVASFEAIYAHYNGGAAPQTTDIVPDDRPVVSGRALSLGENKPAAGAAVEIWPVDPANGQREGASPLATFTADENGYWGPVEVEPGAYYEFLVSPVGEGAIPVHYYREPFVRSNSLVYLRILPAPDTLAGILLADLPYSDTSTILVNFTSSTGILVGRDSLTIDGVEMSNETFATAENTTIAVFVYDENRNGTSDGTSVATFESFPFLKGIDRFLPADPAGFVEVNFNDRVLRAARWPSASDGVTITLFD
jgi:pimeloyl-ACP methyl ester carboxylesterase